MNQVIINHHGHEPNPSIKQWPIDKFSDFGLEHERVCVIHNGLEYSLVLNEDRPFVEIFKEGENDPEPLFTAYLPPKKELL